MKLGKLTNDELIIVSHALNEFKFSNEVRAVGAYEIVDTIEKKVDILKIDRRTYEHYFF